MGVTNTPLLEKTNFCKFSPSRPQKHHLFPENLFTKSLYQSIPFIKVQSSRSHAVPRGESLPVCAHLRRPSRRRNSLREKLIDSRKAQVRELSEIPFIDSNSQGCDHVIGGTKTMGLSSDSDVKNEKVESISISSENVEFSGNNSALWDRLENWVEIYNKDSEFWGIGSGPIFTVYRDSEGNVSRVSVSEEEIIRRSQVRALSFEKKQVMEEFSDLKSKIACAERIAKEIETGAYVLPKNSSIAKFVVEGKQTSLVQGLRSVPLSAMPLLKFFPWFGFTVLCCCSVLCVMTKLYVKKIDKVELSSEEIEMLRRKKKARMEEEVNKSSIEVLQNVPELPIGSYEKRPQLDRNELMKSIMQAKTSRENLALSESSTNFDVPDPEFDRKVRVIRKMAKQAREVERQVHAQFDEKVDGDDNSSISIVTKEPNGTRNALAEIKSRKEAHKSPLARNASLLDGEKNKGISVPLGGKKMLIEDNVRFANDAPGPSDIKKSLKEIPDKINAEKFVGGNMTSNEDVLRDTKIEQIKVERVVLSHREINKTSNDGFTRVSGRTKPKIICSVMEAREYLAKKHGNTVDNVQTDQVIQAKSVTGVIEADKDTDDAPNEEKIQNHSLSAKAVDFSQKNNVAFVKRVIDTSDDSYVKSVAEMIDIHDLSKVKLSEDSIECAKSPNRITNFRMREEKDVNNQKEIQDVKSGEQLGVNGGLQKLDTENTILLTGSRDLRFEKLNNEPKDADKIGMNSCNYTSDTTQASESLEISLNGSGMNVSFPSVEFYGNGGQSPSQEFYNAKDNNSSMPGSKFEKHKDDICVFDMTGDGSSVTEDQNISMKNKMLELYEAQMVPKLDDPCVLNPCSHNGSLDDSKFNQDIGDLSRSKTSFLQDSVRPNCDTEAKPATDEKSWLEKNFQEFGPIIKKIGSGFRENYMTAKEKTQGISGFSAEISELGLTEGDEELEWMNDEKLREIVFQVRGNELAGRDPFHLMDADDKRAFFEGLECKAEKVNQKLLGLHEWVHSRVENLDYGADGISLDDQPEKIIPRWKGPSYDKTPEFMNSSRQRRKTTLVGKVGASDGFKDSSISSLHKSQEALGSSDSPHSLVNGEEKISIDDTSANPKAQTLIECSDGSSRVGKKGGKEHWEHTKKWSEGFLEVYNAETDPEIKSIMRDMGKDLDRWYTDKDRQDVADLVTRLSNRKRKFIEKKMDKLKREMQMFGPQAVVSKYREYSDEKEEDYLWWLDLRFVLCIELYTIEGSNPRVGFYSLEMAADLELDPKQYHVIAFEDPGDSKNFCYIIQAHMDMLGSGKAFVIARPPKDAFRDAKANGFNVTVIRKGEIQLNVDQTLEEVEEEITEIGSKIYHDKIMHERAVDIRSLLKGVITAEKSTKRSKKVLKNPKKN
ncbi:hypothetical protein J5N97_026047 [Dioscorea zingiberensis]|uniref:Uncharacterized protein n=1 Tax=Dioscorea zingiberensis TaxID=325984 RepID=A0A9D5H656_9LILI|nr:hypothetical protein J5N97_026047 [Dioscorea zingiberensis]